jgi:hypothetical protein
MPKLKKQSAYLDAVTKARTELVLAKATLEAKLREQLERDLANMQTRVDLAVRYAYDNGHSKAQILQAMGSKYYGIVNDSLERTEGVDEVRGVHPLASVYTYDRDAMTLTVRYDNHGPQRITGNAEFFVVTLEDGSMLFNANQSLWNHDYTVKNDVVAVLSNIQDGFYYEEAVQWVTDSEKL